MQLFEITDEYVTLGQALKWAGIISTGGEARDLLNATKIMVNGERDARRGRKLRPGDVVEVPGEEAIQIAVQTEPEPEPEPEPTPSPQVPPKVRRVVVRRPPPGVRTVARRRTP